MGPAVEDVHHGHRQKPRVEAADIAEERLVELDRRGARGGETDAEDRVGPEPALVFGPIEGDQRGIEAGLLRGLHAAQRREDLLVDGAHGLLHTLAAETRPAVAALDRLVGAGRSAGGNRRAALGTVLQQHIDLDGRIAAAVQYLPCPDIGDRTHSWPLPSAPAVLDRGHARCGQGTIPQSGGRAGRAGSSDPNGAMTPRATRDMAPRERGRRLRMRLNRGKSRPRYRRMWAHSSVGRAADS